MGSGWKMAVWFFALFVFRLACALLIIIILFCLCGYNLCRFPTHRKEVAAKWIAAMRRKNWTPTIYSRVCSIHFEDNCFFAKKGSRLRLLPDSIPTIFDFRKIPSNRKKVQYEIICFIQICIVTFSLTLYSRLKSI